MHNPIEEWKSVVGHEGYEISNTGKLRRITIFELKPHKTRKGYLRICLSNDGKKKTFAMHRLVAAAFLGPRPEDKFVNHIDGNKQNNSAANLEYVTPKENTAHAIALGLMDPTRRFRKASKLTPAQVQEIWTRFGKETYRTIAADYGVTRAAVIAIRRGRCWKHLMPESEAKGLAA